MRAEKNYSFIIIFLGALFFIGVFYHINSSEFWPVTISKTWFTPPNFEFSMLQKPLFTFFLSLFHILPLSDISHLYLVKCFFSLLGVVGIFLYFESNRDSNKNLSGIFLFVLLSPLYMQNFFRIRSDQIGFFMFALMLFLISRKRIKGALLILFLIPFFGVKEILFWIPGLTILAPHLKPKWKNFTLRIKLFFVGIMMASLVWLIALNISSIYYLAETFSHKMVLGLHLRTYLMLEWPLILSVLIVNWVTFQKEDKMGRAFIWASLASLVLIVGLPQSYPFYIASLCFIIYLPLIRFIQTKLHFKKVKIALGFLVLLQLLNIGLFTDRENFPLYVSNRSEFLFIKSASQILATHHLSYLDGMGMFPKQKFIPCFVSPDDADSNLNCLRQIKNSAAESIVVTQRRMFLGEEIFKQLDQHYDQLKPNFWIIKNKFSQIPPSEIDLANGPIPIFTFGF